MIDDYNNYYDFIRKAHDFQTEVCDNSSPNKYNDIIFRLMKSNDNLREKYKISKEGYLFLLMSKYCHCAGKLNGNDFLNHPFIKSYKFDKNVYLKTIVGDIKFTYWITGFIRAVKMSRDSKIPVSKYLDVFLGKYNRRCHEGAITFGNGYNIITSLMPYMLEDMKFLHSYLEKDGKVLDITINAEIDKDEYYDRFKPNELSDINLDDLKMVLKLTERYPHLGTLSIKDILVNYDKIVIDPESVRPRIYYK